VAEGKLPAITAAFEKFAKVEPTNPMSQFLYAKALSMGTSDPAQVEALLRKSIELDSKVWESHFELGLALERRQAFADAAVELERAAQLKPDDPAPHYRLARVYDRLGRAADAAAERAVHARLTSPTKTGVESR
jgi:cytochrome c-type biogenesis protein CcmH/NrfG